MSVLAAPARKAALTGLGCAKNTPRAKAMTRIRTIELIRLGEELSTSLMTYLLEQGSLFGNT